MTVVVIRPEELPLDHLRVLNDMVERQGQTKHVLFIVVTLTSDLEKKLAGIRNGQPVIQVKEG